MNAKILATSVLFLAVCSANSWALQYKFTPIAYSDQFGPRANIEGMDLNDQGNLALGVFQSGGPSSVYKFVNGQLSLIESIATGTEDTRPTTVAINNSNIVAYL